MSDVKIGRLPGEKKSRDAIHVPVGTFQAAENLRVGARVNIRPSDGKVKLAGTLDPFMGIVDPWLEYAFVKEGEWVWVLFKPGFARGVRHAWSHPDLPKEEDTEGHQFWTRERVSRLKSELSDLDVDWCCPDDAAMESLVDRLNGRDS